MKSKEDIMTKKQKIIIITISILFIVLIFIMSLSKIMTGNGDWKYELKNNYQIWRVNSNEIIIGKIEDDSTLTPSINNNVVKFKYNDNYAVVGCSNDLKDNNLKYYIINLTTDEIIGPLNNNDLDKENINITMDWIKTKPTPSGAKYE